MREECILSLLLLNIYSENIMRWALRNWNRGISVGGKRISNLRYADGITSIAAEEE